MKTLFKIVVEEVEPKNVKFNFTEGVDSGTGLKGDIKNMMLDIGRLTALGWKPIFGREETSISSPAK